MGLSKKLITKAKLIKSNSNSNSIKSKKSNGKKLKDESSSDEDEDDKFEDTLQSLNQDEDDDDDDDSEEDEEDSEDSEEDDVTEEALERMMKLLGDVDPEELALLEAEMKNNPGSQDEDDSEVDEDDDDEEGVDDDESYDEDVYLDLDAESDIEGLEGEEGVEEEQLFEDIEEQDGDTVPVERTTVNDKVALARVLASFKTETTFFDTLSLTYPTPLNIPDAENDLERELEFYKQSLWAVQHAATLFEAASLPFTRPDDYFAEMLKTDAHMSLIRQSLLNESAGIKASEDARKLRDAKKFGKKVQVERLKEREKEKKDVGKRLESLKKKRKAGDGGGFSTTEDFDIALEDAIAGPSKRSKPNESERGSRGRGGRGAKGDGRGISRRGRDSKFGNPTTSRRPKENNDRTDGDGSSGRGRGRGGARGGRGGGRGGSDRGRGASKQRLGKSRRN